jgi:DnaA-homolog protein
MADGRGGAAGIIAPVKQLVLDLIPPPQPTLDNFVVGRNAELVAALRLLPETAAGAVSVLYLWGAAGSGKSHLLAALDRRGLRRADNGPDLAAADADQRLGVDDVDRLDAAAQQALFNLINRQQGRSGVVVAAGSFAPRDLPIRRDLASRLGSGLVFQLHTLSDAEKVAALHAHARSRGFVLRDEVVNYLLRHARRDMPSLMSFLDALDRHSIETGREITLPLIREIAQPAPA